MSTSGLAAAILDLSLSFRSDSIVGITVGLLDPENSRWNCVAIMCTSGDMSILDWRLPSWIYHFRLGRTVL